MTSDKIEKNSTAGVISNHLNAKLARQVISLDDLIYTLVKNDNKNQLVPVLLDWVDLKELGFLY